MPTKIEIGQTHVPKRAKNEIELKTVPTPSNNGIERKKVPTRTHCTQTCSNSDQNAEVARNSKDHNTTEGTGEEERETGVKDTGEDKKRDRDRLVEISEKSHEANGDGRWLLMSVVLNGGCCRLWWWIYGVHVCV